MPYAIVQMSLKRPSVAQLRRAFASSNVLTANDAVTLARNAYGILAVNITRDDACTLQRALKTEGVPVQVVDQAALVGLPPGKRLKRADCGSQALIVYDALGRPGQVDWSQVFLIAAGSVATARRPEDKAQRAVFTGRSEIESLTLPAGAKPGQRSTARLALEIFIAIEPYRYQAFARELRYNYLGQRLHKSVEANFALFVADLMRYAPDAIANRGAKVIRQDKTRTFRYPSRRAFLDEITWLFWRARREAAS